MDHSHMDHGNMGHGDMDMGGQCNMNVLTASHPVISQVGVLHADLL